MDDTSGTIVQTEMVDRGFNVIFMLLERVFRVKLLD
jgi:hypothetical protein